MKSELAALDRKIQLELAPRPESTPGNDKTQEHGQEQDGGQAIPKGEKELKPMAASDEGIHNPIIIEESGFHNRSEIGRDVKKKGMGL